MKKSLHRFARAVLLGACFAACAPDSPKSSSETHFVSCKTDADCIEAGVGSTCVAGYCRLGDAETDGSHAAGGAGAGGSTGSFDASLEGAPETGAGGAQNAVDASGTDGSLRDGAWSGQMSVTGSTPNAGYYGYGLGVAADGSAIAAWESLDADNVTAHHLASHYTPASGWSAAVELLPRPSGSEKLDEAPVVAMSVNGEAMILWGDAVTTDAGERHVIRAVHYGSSWEPSITIAAPTSSLTYAPIVAVGDASGNFVVSWTQYETAAGPLRPYVARYDRASGWSAPIAPAAVETDAGVPGTGGATVSVDVGGNAIVAWVEQPGTGGSGAPRWLRALRYSRSSGWQSPETLAAGLIPGSGAGLGGANAVIDGAGNAVVAWVRPKSGATLVDAMASTFSGGTWTTTTLDSVSAGPGAVLLPRIATDSHGTFVATWILDAAPNLVDVHASRLVVGGAWSSPVTLNTPAALAPDGGPPPFQYSIPSVAMGTNGDAVASWTRFDEANAQALQAATFSPGSGWSAPRTVAPTIDWSAPAVADPAGDATLLWETFGKMWAVRYAPGYGWTAPVRLDDGIHGGGAGKLAVGANGAVVASWFTGGAYSVSANVFQ